MTVSHLFSSSSCSSFAAVSSSSRNVCGVFAPWSGAGLLRAVPGDVGGVALRGGRYPVSVSVSFTLLITSLWGGSSDEGTRGLIGGCWWWLLSLGNGVALPVGAGE